MLLDWGVPPNAEADEEYRRDIEAIEQAERDAWDRAHERIY